MMLKDSHLNLLFYTEKIKLFFISMCSFSLVTNILAIILLQQIAKLTDKVMSNDWNDFIRLIPVTIIIIVFEITANYFGDFVKNRYKARTACNIRNKVYRQVINTSFHEKESISTAKLISFYNNEIQVIVDYILVYPNIIINPIIIVIAFMYFASISLSLLLISCILIPSSSFLYNKFLKPFQGKTKEILDAKAGLNNIIKDSIKGFYVIQSYGLQQYFVKKYEDASKSVEMKERDRDKIVSVLGRIFILLRYIPQLVIPLYGGYLCFNSQISLGELLACNSLIWYIISPIESLLDIRKKARSIIPTRENLDHILGCKQENSLQHNSEYKQKDTVLSIKNLTFSYGQDRNVLNQLNLRMPFGEKIKIIGKSGSGKSTLIKTICGLNTAFEGSVEINCLPVNEENAVKVRELISYMPQEPYMFQGTLFENITMGRDFSNKEVLEAAKQAGAFDFIMSFPDTLNTIIGNNGVQLSGGQKKRIALLRAFLNDGLLFILDEPFAGLDKDNILHITNGINEVCKEKSYIMITHQLDCIDENDKVYQLKEGILYEE